jgi:alanyl aminopeptidase
MGNKVVENLYPDYQASVSQLMSVQRAMRSDSLTSARQIRQPVEDSHDIRNAFDTITYSKGGGVLEMFERWMGEEAFQRGVQQHIERHRFGVANFEDLLESLDSVTDKPLVEPFRSFLFQPGVPFVEMAVQCEGDTRRLTLKQSRYFPVGSPGSAEQTWSIPICVRYEAGGEVKSQCTLLTEQEGAIDLETEQCPTWVMPNDDAAGYFRFALDAEGMDALRRRGWRSLTPREKLAVADSVRAGFDNASLAANEVFDELSFFAESDVRPVTTTPTGLIGFAEGYVLTEDLRPRAQRYGQRLYRSQYRRLGWGPRGRREEDGETKLLREDVLGFLAFTAEDAQVRRQGERLGQAYVRDGEIHPDAVDSNVAGLALSIAVQEGDAAFFDQLTEMLFASTDATVRSRILSALGSAKDPTLAARARALSLDARLRVNEVTRPLWSQSEVDESREALWQWVVENFDALSSRIGPHSAGSLPWMAAGFCDEQHAAAVEEFFRPRIDDLAGGPRNLAGAVEAIRLCAARVEAHREATTEFFSAQR